MEQKQEGMMSKREGSITHLEVFARDLQESAKFYASVFGWKTSPHDAGYLFWEDTEGFSGGFATAGSPMTNPAATFFVRVNDIPATLARVIESGGVIVREKREIGGGHGYFAIFRDPAGNNIGLQCSQ
jgi:predicted enzyme related to lactoylglutathione lyase